MAATNRIKETLAGGGAVFGAWLQTASPTVANMQSAARQACVEFDSLLRIHA